MGDKGNCRVSTIIYDKGHLIIIMTHLSMMTYFMMAYIKDFGNFQEVEG